MGTGTSNNLIEENYIGTDVGGTLAKDTHGNSFANKYDGVYIQSGANSNTVGGTAGTNSLNVISNNGANGVEIASNTNLVEGNYIGTDKNGTNGLDSSVNKFTLRNINDGILIAANANSNTIGGTGGKTTLNVISNNGNNGIEINSSSNVVEGNYVGIGSDGKTTKNSDGTSLGNFADGVLLGTAATKNTIGGTAAAAGNVISNNGASGKGFGIDIKGDNSTLVEFDIIGYLSDGTTLAKNISGGISGKYTDGGNNTIQP